MDTFSYTDEDFHEQTQCWNNKKEELSQFDKTLRSKWDKAMDDGYFRYKLDIEDTKIIGDKEYVAQLNIKRAQERRKPDTITTVNQPFNPASFNFTKIKPGEILFELVKKKPCSDGDGSQSNSECNGDVKQERHQVIINVSPLEYGHILLVPDIDACRPQILTEEALKLSIEMMLLSKHRGFRVGFNSLCAFASVNHQHLHAYYLDRELFVESSPVEHLSGPLFELVTMPAKGFAFQLHGNTLQQMARTLFLVADYFQQQEIAHNLYVTRGPVFGEARGSSCRTIRAYLWPRQKFIGSMWLKDEAAFNVALVELAGHLPIKIGELFKDLDEKQVEDTIREAALEEAEYQHIKRDVISICAPKCDVTSSSAPASS